MHTVLSVQLTDISASNMLTHGLCFIHSQNHHPVAKLLISQPERYDVTTGMLVLVSIVYGQSPFVMTYRLFSSLETMIDSKPHVESTTTKKVLIKTIETRDGQVEST